MAFVLRLCCMAIHSNKQLIEVRGSPERFISSVRAFGLAVGQISKVVHVIVAFHRFTGVSSIQTLSHCIDQLEKVLSKLCRVHLLHLIDQHD